MSFFPGPPTHIHCTQPPISSLLIQCSSSPSPLFSWGLLLFNTVTSPSWPLSTYIFTVQFDPLCQSSAAAPSSPTNLLPSFRPLRSSSLSFCILPTPNISYCVFAPTLSSSADLLRFPQWNTGDLQSRSTKLFRFTLLHPVDLTCIQESKLNSSFSLRILGYSTLQSDCTFSWSGYFSSDDPQASSGVIIFVRQGLFFF